jgi:hypothetical protein
MYSSDVSFQERTRRTLRVRAPSGLPRHRWGLAPFCFWAQTPFPSYCPLYLLIVSSQTFCDQGDSGGASKFRSIEENVPPHRRVSGTNLRLPILVSELANFRLAAETAQQKILLPPFVQMRESTPFSACMLLLEQFRARAARASCFSTVGTSALLPVTGCLFAVVNHSIEMEKQNL